MIGVVSMLSAIARRCHDRGTPPSSSTVPRDVLSVKAKLDAPSQRPSTIDLTDARSADRFVPSVTATVVTTKTGKRFAARIINVSRTGVAIEPEQVGIAPDDIVMVGKHPVMPGRRLRAGVVLTFVKPIDVKDCGRDLIL